MWAYRILIAGLVVCLVGVFFLVCAFLFGPRLHDPSDLGSCFSVKIPPGVEVVEKDVEAPDHINIYFQVNHCSKSFYQELLAHSEQVGDSKAQRSRSLSEFHERGLDIPHAGPDSCEANYVSVASYGAAILYSPLDKQAVIFIDTY